MEERFKIEMIEQLQYKLGKEELMLIEGVLDFLFQQYTVSPKKNEIVVYDGNNDRIISQFLAIKRLEGKSENTLKQYHDATHALCDDLNKNIQDITTNDIRYHLANYQAVRKVSNATLDNKRRFLSSFFAWLTAEEYIKKNPMLLIKKIKQDSVVKKPFSDTELEQMRDNIDSKKEKALFEFLLSTGCRISEVTRLNISDINFDTGECIVFGKGAKERKVYINDKTLYHLKEYLKKRKDEEQALFLNKHGTRLQKGSAEAMLHKIGNRANVSNVHPHRFRRTFATNLVKRGVPIEHVQKLMGHTTLDMTMHYCTINDDSIKFEYKKLCVA